MRKHFLIAVVAAGAVLAAPSGAAAGTYPPPDNTIVADDTTVVVGQDVTYTAKTFTEDSPVTFTFNSAPIVLGTVNADAAGVAVLTAAVPNVAPGAHRVDASGTGADGMPLTVSLDVTVAGSTEGGGDLPRTGSDSSLPLAQMGAGAVVAGGLLVLVARRRRTVGA